MSALSSRVIVIVAMAVSAIALPAHAAVVEGASDESLGMQQAGKEIARRAKSDAEKNARGKEGQVSGEGGQSAGGSSGGKKAAKAPVVPPKARALAFRMKDIDGVERDLNEFEGKVILIVNTASRCGYTPQYAALQELYKKHEERGFVVLAFPANSFGAQEPGTNEEIKQFCSEKYQVTFPIFAKVDVAGAGICPLYKYLTGTNVGHRFGGDIKWNFTKFLINRRGQVIGRFDSKEDPLDGRKITAAIKKALDEPKPGEARAAPKPKSKSPEGPVR